MDIWDLYILFGLSLTVVLITLITLLKILKRNPKNRLNQILALTFFCYFTHFITLLYRLSIPANLLLISPYHLYKISFYYLALGTGFLLLYIAILYKPDIMVITKNQIIFIGIYAALLSVLFVIPDGVTGALTEEGIFSDAVFSLPLTIYLECFFFSVLILDIIMSAKIHRSFMDPELAKRMRLVSTLSFVYYYHVIGLTLTNHLNIETYRNAFSISEVVIIIVVILLYFAFSQGLISKK